MGQEKQTIKDQRDLGSLSVNSDLKEKVNIQTESFKKGADPENVSDSFRRQRNLKVCKEQDQMRSEGYEHVHELEGVSRHHPSSEKVGTKQEMSDICIACPSKKFKRPKSYIRGRNNCSKNLCCSERNETQGQNPMASAVQAEEPKKSSRLESKSVQDEHEMAALSRINYLNKKLKAQEPTRDYFKSLQGGNSSGGITLDPEPPTWSYESYSESERKEASLPGLRSYIRTHEHHLGDECVEKGEVDPSLGHAAHESLVGYLDGVLSSRYSLKKCSMDLDLKSEFDNTQATDGDWKHKKEQRCFKQSSGNFKEKSHRKKSNSLHRAGSEERVRRLVVGVYEEKPEDNDFEECGEMVEEGELVFSESGERCIQQFSTPGTKTPPVAWSRSQLETSSGDAQQKTKGHPAFTSQTKEKHCDRQIHLAKKGRRNSRQETPNITEAKLSSNVESLEFGPNISNCGRESNAEKRKAFVLSSQGDPSRSPSAGKLLIHSSHAVIPIIQTQEMPLAVEGSYLSSSYEDENPEISYMNEESSMVQGTPKNRRLIVRKDKSSARIWSSSRSLQESERHSLSRRFSCGLDEGEVHDGDDEEYEEDYGDEDDDDDGDEYKDLIIQTELSEGSKVIVSNSDGPIADIEHGKSVGCEAHQSPVTTKNHNTPGTREVTVLNDYLTNKARNKSKNNLDNDKSITSSLSSSHRGKRPLKAESKSSSKAFVNKDDGTLSSPSDKCRPAVGNEDAKAKWKSSIRSPPKASVISSPKGCQREGSARGQGSRRNEPITKEEITIPMSCDGKTRVLLVLRTPPKKHNKDSYHSKIDDERRVSERNKKTTSPQSSQVTCEKNSSTQVERSQLNSKLIPKASKSHEFCRKVESLKKQGNSNEFPQRMPSVRQLSGPPLPDADMKSPAPYNARSEKQRDFRKQKLDSIVPKPCGQLGNSHVPSSMANVKVESGDEENSTPKLDDSNDPAPPEGDPTLNDSAAIAEAAIKAHGRCKFSLYHPCRHDLNVPEFTSMAKVKRHFERKPKPNVSEHHKDIEIDHGPCSFNRYRPCSHVTHSPCQFNQYRPCQHNECELPLRAPVPTHDVSNSPTMKKHEKTSRPNGYIYNSKKLQDRLGTHSPCVYTKYKPCLHEELVGSLDNLNNIGAVSLLASTSKNSSKIDAKLKKKEVNLNTEQCKFDRFNPCFHENEFRFNKALGRNVTLRPEKSKVQPVSQTVEGVSSYCRYGPLQPCFCQDRIEAMKDSCPELLSNAEETIPAQQLQPNDVKFSSQTSKKSFKISNDFVSSKEYAGTYNNAAANSRKEKDFARGALPRAPADGPELKVRSPTPTSIATLEAGEGGLPKPDGDTSIADQGAEQSGAMSLMARISRAWFSSAQAQVARLAPPPKHMVNPALRPDKALGSNIKPDPNIEAVINNAGVAAFGAAAETYSLLQERRQKSPLKHDKASGGCKFLSDHSRGGHNENAKSLAGLENPFKGLAYHEMPLAETERTFENCETDVSQVTEIPELTLSGMTYTRAISSTSESQYFRGVGSDGSSLTESCSGKPDSIVNHPISRQVWTRGDGIPEDFLVLTSNVFPINLEGGGFGETVNIATLVEDDSEVLSADPLPAHFSDVAKSNRGDEENDRQLLKNNPKNLHAGQAGLILCHSPQDHHGRNWTNDSHHCSSPRDDLSPRQLIRAGLIEKQLLGKRRIDKDETSFGNEYNTTHDDSQREYYLEEANAKSNSDYTTRGDVSADPLSQHHKQNGKKIYPRCMRRKHRHDTASRRDFQAKQNKSGKLITNPGAVIKGNNLLLKKGVEGECGNFEKRTDSDLDKDYPQAGLPSKGKEAVVVAAVELASYQSLLNTIKKITREESSVSNSKDVKGQSSTCKLNKRRRNRSSFPNHKHPSTESNRENSHTSIEGETEPASITDTDSSESTIESEADSGKSSSSEATAAGHTVIEDKGPTILNTQLESCPSGGNSHEKSKQIISKQNKNLKTSKELSSDKCKEKSLNESVTRLPEKQRGCLSFRVSGLHRDTFGSGGSEEVKNFTVVPSSKYVPDLQTLNAKGYCATRFRDFYSHLEDEYKLEAAETPMVQCGNELKGGGASATAWDSVAVWNQPMSEEEQTDETDTDSTEESSDGEEGSYEAQENERKESDKDEDGDDTDDEEDGEEKSASDV